MVERKQGSANEGSPQPSSVDSILREERDREMAEIFRKNKYPWPLPPSAFSHPVLTRAVVARMWKKQWQPKSHALEELTVSYNEQNAWHAISYVNLWRLEEEEKKVNRQIRTGQNVTWNDPDQDMYVKFLLSALKMVHEARWRKSITETQSDSLLDAAISVLGNDEKVRRPVYVQLLESKDQNVNRPHAKEALAATLALLDKFAAIDVEVVRRFLVRVERPRAQIRTKTSHVERVQRFGEASKPKSPGVD